MSKEYKMNNIVTVDKDGAIDLNKVLIGTDIEAKQVAYYEMENGGEGIRLTLFDKNKKQIKVRVRTVKNLAEDINKIIKRCSKSWFPEDLIKLIASELK